MFSFHNLKYSKNELKIRKQSKKKQKKKLRKNEEYR